MSEEKFPYIEFSENYHQYIEEAKNTETSQFRLEQLMYVNMELAKIIAENPHISSSIVFGYLHIDDLCDIVVKNPAYGLILLEDSSEEFVVELGKVISQHTQDPETLHELFSLAVGHDFLSYIAYNRFVSPKTLELFLHLERKLERLVGAQSHYCTTELLDKFSNDPFFWVREAVADHKNTSRETLEILCNDEKLSVVEKAKKALEKRNEKDQFSNC